MGPSFLLAKDATDELVRVFVGEGPGSLLFLTICCFFKLSSLRSEARRFLISHCSASRPILSSFVAFFHCFLRLLLSLTSMSITFCKFIRLYRGCRIVSNVSEIVFYPLSFLLLAAAG